MPLPPRIGFTASRKVGIAVVRNRARRRLKAAAEQVLPQHGAPGFDYVAIARTETVTRPFAELVADIDDRDGAAERARNAPPDAKRGSGMMGSLLARPHPRLSAVDLAAAAAVLPLRAELLALRAEAIAEHGARRGSFSP